MRGLTAAVDQPSPRRVTTCAQSRGQPTRERGLHPSSGSIEHTPYDKHPAIKRHHSSRAQCRPSASWPARRTPVQETSRFRRAAFPPGAAADARRLRLVPRHQIGEANVVILVAENDGQVIGYTYGAVEGYDYMSLRGPAAVLHDLIVDPAYRRRGVGELLLNAALSNLKSRGAPRVVLSTAERNNRRRGCSSGWVSAGRWSK